MPADQLLGSDDPAPFEILTAEATTPILLICDHASRGVPKCLDGLGIPDNILKSHIGWDIGAADVTRHLSEKLQATAVLANYSRLVIDNNRDPGELTSIPAESDGVTIPGNQNITPVEVSSRTQEIFAPYHLAVETELDRLSELGSPPALFSVHSFTPSLQGVERVWDVSVLWNEDGELALRVAGLLRSNDPTLIVGENEPYSGKFVAATLNRHGAPRGILHMVIEIRQDQLEKPEDVLLWSDRLARVLEQILAKDARRA